MIDQGIIYALGGIGSVTALWSGYRAVRWFVHKGDAIELAANNVSLATALIIREFGENGGRMTSRSIAEGVKSSTIKELLADQRVLLIEQSALIAKNEEKADQRSRGILNELKKSNA